MVLVLFIVSILVMVMVKILVMVIFMVMVAQWAKSGGEAFLLQFSDFTKDPMHDFNRLFC